MTDQPDAREIAAKLTKGQKRFYDAVRQGSGEQFHRSVIEPLEHLGLVRWQGGMRLIGCNSFSASRFIICVQEQADHA